VARACEITAELPGLDEKDIEVSTAGGMLTIKAEKQEVKEEKETGYYLHERHHGAFERSFGIPEGVAAEYGRGAGGVHEGVGRFANVE
jgi:HSP20 family protein